jgi:hypothetical protein
MCGDNQIRGVLQGCAFSRYLFNTSINDNVLIVDGVETYSPFQRGLN